MRDQNARQFSARGHEYCISVNLNQDDPPTHAEPNRVKYDRKYNIRVKQEDVALIDALAKQHDVKRSVLLNHLLHEILLDGLRSIEDRDARLLIAQTADSRASYEDLARGWVYDAIENESEQIVGNIACFNQAQLYVQDDQYAPPDHDPHSDTYRELQQVLKEMKE
jgi:hypothetical protein